jgi:glycosyltransferase involved in cell wall biosynthesis
MVYTEVLYQGSSILFHPSVTVLICTLNEEKNLCSILPKIPIWVDEVILVDGHSTDKTVEVAKKLIPSIRLFYQPNKGKGEALRFGISQATKDIVVTLDADGATIPQDIPKFIRSLLTGYDFAKGSRFIVCSPANKASHRVFGNLLIAAVFNLLYACHFTDLCSGYNAFWRKSLEKIDFDSTDWFEDEPLLISRAKRAGLRIIEVGHVDCGRKYGNGKAPSWRQGFKAIKTITRERLYG